MAEYTIEITSYCPHDCEYCSTDASIKGKHLDLDTIKKFLEDNKISTSDRINISGGEPLAHPNFWEILQMCKALTPDVWVYTNALTQIRYNTTVIKEIKVEANVCLQTGKDVYIPKNVNKVHLLQLIPQGRAKNMKSAEIKLSGCDCAKCQHKVLQADGLIANAPCQKKYK